MERTTFNQPIPVQTTIMWTIRNSVISSINYSSEHYGFEHKWNLMKPFNLDIYYLIVEEHHLFCKISFYFFEKKNMFLHQVNIS